ncbi:hypothetical protein B0H19DRAFT_1229118 [Mycena capillaripes]|nr:hypothetical protein B0H19DRAFT_1229118 [Mycena capillaripes]
MRYVSQHTDIPIPRVWFSFKWGTVEYIVMDRIHGVTLCDALRSGLIQGSDKEDILAGQLTYYMARLRSLAPPPNSSSISSVIGGPVKCARLFSDPGFGPVVPTLPTVTGPFETEGSMNLQLRHLHTLDSYGPVVVAAHSKRLGMRGLVSSALGDLQDDQLGTSQCFARLGAMDIEIFPGDAQTYGEELEADTLLRKQFWVPEVCVTNTKYKNTRHVHYSKLPSFEQGKRISNQTAQAHVETCDGSQLNKLWT